eukprot:TRINITY_DN7301_c0_g1_i1.p1 TRINITY_DN7301_c0_g1~~TRINITY_DN7301_c0_g1_i1.p1  ORF type:complete len:226 (-),score=21.73 TRINITY_DN7301_c0_g1_i1:98-736(-)
MDPMRNGSPDKRSGSGVVRAPPMSNMHRGSGLGLGGLGEANEQQDEEFTDAIDVDRDLFPRCIVWTPIHGCTWCFPFVGHMGIATERGEVWEFMGGGATPAPKGGLSFGPVCRYVQLNRGWIRRGGSWDAGIANGIKRVQNNPHGACVSNCHTFVAECLHEMRYGGIPCWNWLSYLLAIWIFFFGKFTTCPRSTLYIIPCCVAIVGIYFLLH